MLIAELPSGDEYSRGCGLVRVIKLMRSVAFLNYILTYPQKYIPAKMPREIVELELHDRPEAGHRSINSTTCLD